MKLNYTEVWNRCWDDNNYPALMSVETLIQKDIQASLDKTQAARDNFSAIKGYSVELLQAEIESQKAEIEYNEKLIAHLKFYGEGFEILTA